MTDLVIIGVPTSAGAHHAGQDLAPDALRAAGLPDKLSEAGINVEDAGNLPGAVFAPDHAHPQARNLAAVATVAREVADAVEKIVSSGLVPVVLGGDCTITLGAVAGYQRVHSDVGLFYLDGDTDLGYPGNDEAGILDAMGVSHLLGRGAPELTGLGRSAPLLRPERLALVGGDPRETNEAGRQFLADRQVSFTEGPALTADPAAVAQQALDKLTGSSSRVLVHFDVDVVDSGDLPLGNFPHYGSGVTLDAALAALRVARAAPSFGGLVLTEVNPTHDPSGTELGRLVAGLAAALAG